MDTGTLHLEVRGEGPALVLAHGFGGSARNFRPQVRALADGHRVATFDARGHARSPAPPEAQAYTADALVEAFAEVVQRVEPAPGAAVVGGLSMGAATAALFALAQPARVRGLVLASPPAGPGSGRGVAARALAFADALEREGLEGAGARFVWGPDSGLDDAGAALVRQGFLEHAPHGLAHTLRQFLARLPDPVEWAPGLSALGLPVLIVAGEEDAASLPTARALAQALPTARLAVIEQAGHVVNLARPEPFNRELRAFLECLD